jgi:hypothetical protein
MLAAQNAVPQSVRKIGTFPVQTATLKHNHSTPFSCNRPPTGASANQGCPIFPTEIVATSGFGSYTKFADGKFDKSPR